MTQEEAFWQAVLDEPEVDAHRLIYADWLEDQGDAASLDRADFIRVQVELAAQPADARQLKELKRREAALLQRRRAEWLRPLEELGCLARHFRRGFVEQVDIPTPALLQHGDTLFRLTPLRHLVLCLSRDLLRELTACRHLARLARLSMPANQVGPAGAAVLARCPYLHSLEGLWLGRNGLGPTGLAALLERDTFAGLRVLDLRYNDLGPTGVRVLTASPHLSNLTHLNLASNNLDRDAGRRLATATTLPRLTSLDLADNAFGPEPLAALASSPLLGQLTELNLSGTDQGEVGLLALAAAPAARNLRKLRIRNDGDNIPARLVQALTSSPHLSSLAELEVVGYRLENRTVRPLQARFGDGFRVLSRWDTPPFSVR